jgi:hypothetical protein
LAGRNPEEAVRHFLEPLKAVVGCVTVEGFVTRRSDRHGDERRTAAFQEGFAILDRGNGQSFKLELYHRYTVTAAEGERGPWKVSTAEYIYEVADESDVPIVEFHWHPESGRIAWPHAHAYGTRDSLTLHKLHLPTGRVSIESVVRFLIEDLDVLPIRDDWDEILKAREVAFKQYRSWH